MMRKNSRGQTEQERLQILEERLSEYLYDVYFKYEQMDFPSEAGTSEEETLTFFR